MTHAHGSELYHHGVKGMRWGVRKRNSQTNQRSKFRKEILGDKKNRKDFITDIKVARTMSNENAPLLVRQAFNEVLIRDKGEYYARRVAKANFNITAAEFIAASSAAIALGAWAVSHQT